MKYLKILFITILLLTIMIIQVNATTLTLPELPEEYEFEEYIIFDSSFSAASNGRIKAITFNNLESMYVGNYDEYLDLIYPKTMRNFTYHSHDVLYFNAKGWENNEKNLEVNVFDLVGDDWEYSLSESYSGLDAYRYGAKGGNSITKSHILYSSKDVIKLSDGSVFFFKGSWMKTGMVHPILGIIPFLIGLLIMSVGFSKGLQFLFKTLRKA